MIDSTVTRLQIELTDSTTKEGEVREVKENALIEYKNKSQRDRTASSLSKTREIEAKRKSQGDAFF